jgi:hypothetical protein
MTFHQDGRPIMRPVSAFVEGWTIGTIRQDLHVKPRHLRRSLIVGYLWVDLDPPGEAALDGRNGWVQGRAEQI